MTHQHPEEPPFSNRRRYYLILKIAVLAVAVLLALRLFAPFFTA